MYISGPEAGVKAAAARVLELSEGCRWEECHDVISIRHFVPILAVPRLIPRGTLCPELAALSNVEIRQTPEDDIVTGFSIRGIDMSGTGDDVRNACSVIDHLVESWIATKDVVSDDCN